MLVSLEIKNFLLIKKISINFIDGFNAFTGETGAGKSIIIEGLKLVLGGKNQTTLNLKVKDEGANYLVHKALTIQKANSREFTSSTKTRAEVRGGGRKPWKQKGLGRARAGSNRSPLWRGGGVMFGPKPKKVKVKINKKEKNLALQTLLLNKKEQIIALDKNKETNKIAVNFFKKAEQNHKIKTIIKPALESLIKIRNKKFDLVFIDADKMNYKKYYEISLDLLNKGGLVIIDNVLWHGEVVDKRINDKFTKNIRELNNFISKDKRIEKVIVPFGDGMSVCRKV